MENIHVYNLYYMHMYIHVHVLMRDEKEERKKQARSNKQTMQSNTAHPRQSLFLRKMSCFGWDSNHMYMYTCALYSLCMSHAISIPCV